MSIDHWALLPAYLAAGTAVLALLTDLLLARPLPVIVVTILGALATAAGATAVGLGPIRSTLCAPECSYRASPYAAVVAVVFALLTAGVLALAVPLLRAGPPVGEFCFLLACAMTGGVVLGYAHDLISLIVAVETLTLPLYLLVALRGRRAAESAAVQGSLTFFLVSVVATAVALLGAGLLYAATGALHFTGLAASAAAGVAGPTAALATVGAALLMAGLAFKVAAVPMHAWAPTAYDTASLPVAAYLSTASKLGGVVALLALWRGPLPPRPTGLVLLVVAAATMTVGNLGALRQTRTVRLLAWSSVAQAGYIIAPLAVLGVVADGPTLAVAASAAIAYALFFVVLEFVAFAAVTAVRAPGAGGGLLSELTGVARRRPLVGAALALALIGLAGLPPGLAGLFAKVGVVRALVAGHLTWLAVLVALNAVVGLAYYLPLVARIYRVASPAADQPSTARPVAVALAVASITAIVVGFAPQWVFDAAALGW